jgi:hypothetical protein
MRIANSDRCRGQHLNAVTTLLFRPVPPKRRWVLRVGVNKKPAGHPGGLAIPLQ